MATTLGTHLSIFLASSGTIHLVARLAGAPSAPPRARHGVGRYLRKTSPRHRSRDGSEFGVLLARRAKCCRQCNQVDGGREARHPGDSVARLWPQLLSSLPQGWERASRTRPRQAGRRLSLRLKRGRNTISGNGEALDYRGDWPR